MAIRLYIGRKETGKTTLSYYMARKLPRRVVFDPRGLVRRSGTFIARTQDGFSDGMDRLMADETMELVYASPVDDLRAVAFPHFCAEVRRWIESCRFRSLAVVIDEISFIDIDDADWLMKCCSAEHTHFFLTCHNVSDAPVWVRSIADRWYLFPIHQEHDLSKLAERCGDAAATAAGKLDGRQFVSWHHRDGLRRFDDPRAWFVDLHPDTVLIPPIELDA